MISIFRTTKMGYHLIIIKNLLFSAIGKHDRKSFPESRIAAFNDIGQGFIGILVFFRFEKGIAESGNFF